MADTPDVFSDQLTLVVGPFGCTLMFSQSSPPLAGSAGPTPVVNVRVSLEHLKAIAFILHKGIKNYEHDHVRVAFSDADLKVLAIEPSEWQAFWGEQ